MNYDHAVQYPALSKEGISVTERAEATYLKRLLVPPSHRGRSL